MKRNHVLFSFSRYVSMVTFGKHKERNARLNLVKVGSILFGSVCLCTLVLQTESARSSSLSSSFVCDSGWTTYGLKCYRYVAQKVNFDQALAICLAENGTLASVQSLDELTFLEHLARRHSTASGVHWLWLGGFRQPNLTFRWTDGSPFRFARWRHNCPDRRRSEDCLLMSVFNSKPSHWCNYRCATNFDHAVCQKARIPSPVVPTAFSNDSITMKESNNQTALASHHSCAAQWTLINSTATYNRCVRVLNRTSSWHSALSTCQELNGTLLTIHSQDEQTQVQHFLFNKSAVVEAVWLGAVRMRPPTGLRSKFKDDFVWADDRSSLTFDNFAHHEPDNRDTKENCVAINNVDEFVGRWLDAPCEVQFAIACQRPTIEHSTSEANDHDNGLVSWLESNNSTNEGIAINNTLSTSGSTLPPDLHDLADELDENDAPDAPDSSESVDSADHTETAALSAARESNRLLTTIIDRLSALQQLLRNQSWIETIAITFVRQREKQKDKEKVQQLIKSGVIRNGKMSALLTETPFVSEQEARIAAKRSFEASETGQNWVGRTVFVCFVLLSTISLVALLLGLKRICRLRFQVNRERTSPVGRGRTSHGWSQQQSRTLSFRSLVSAEEEDKSSLQNASVGQASCFSSRSSLVTNDSISKSNPMRADPPTQ